MKMTGFLDLSSNRLTGRHSHHSSLIGTSRAMPSSTLARHLFVLALTVATCASSSSCCVHPGTLTHSHVHCPGGRRAGSIPSEMGRLGSFARGLFLSDNALHGKIPTELFKMNRMQDQLELHNYQICGSIPDEIRNMVVLSGYFSL